MKYSFTTKFREDSGRLDVHIVFQNIIYLLNAAANVLRNEKFWGKANKIFSMNSKNFVITFVFKNEIS